MLLHLLLSLTLTACTDDDKETSDDTEAVTATDDTSAAPDTEEPGDSEDSAGADDTTSDQGGTDDTSPPTSTVTLVVEDNPTLVLEKIFHLTAVAPIEVTVTCTLDGDPEEVHVLTSPAAVEHILPLRGLLASSAYDCAVESTDGTTVFSEELRLETDALSSEYPTASILTTDGERRGYTLLYHSAGLADGTTDRLFIFDEEARIRWYYDSVPGDPKDLDAQLVDDDKVLFGGGFETPPILVDFSHEVLHTGPDASTGLYHHHHAEWLPDGSILSLAAADNSSGDIRWTGFIMEIRDGESGKLSWSWDSQSGADDGTLPTPTPSEAGDSYHANWVGVIDDAAYVNMRETHNLIRIDRASGDILWTLGIDGDFQLLTEAGLPAGPDQWFYGAHGPEINGDRVLLYDNGWTRPGSGGSYSRGVELELDEEAGTAQIVWEFTRDGWYEPIWGDADYHGDDRIILTRGHCDSCSTNVGPSAIWEVDRESREVVWELSFDDRSDSIYRSERIDGCGIFNNQKYCTD